MIYQDFLKKDSLTKEELLSHAYGRWEKGHPEDIASLPTPPLLMFDRVTSISRDPSHRHIKAEADIRLDDWFFQCHFKDDPVQPGCLGVDAVWQLLGLYCTANGAQGTGRALGCKEIAFSGQIRPHNKLVQYEIFIRRYQTISSNNTAMIIGTGKVLVDGELIYEIQNAKVGTFRNIRYTTYPLLGPNAIGGIQA
jgi:3-hydroxyacyl-[acyl-carrier protein] dehydratase/trans-2-decenoyl-[acyl-carrier protein] isomerase